MKRLPRHRRGPQPPEPPRRKIRVWHVLSAALLLLVVGYFAGALALTLWYDRQPHNKITYTDVIHPARWSDLRRLRGEAMIARGVESLQSGRYSEGLHSLRAGLINSPGNNQARLLLARIYTRIRLQPTARETLMGALDATDPGLAFHRTALPLLALGDNAAHLLAYTDRAAALVSPGAEDAAATHELLNRSAIDALVKLGRQDEALARANRLVPPDRALVNELRTTSLLAANRPDEAARLADGWTGDDPKSARALLNAIRTHRQTGDHDRMQAAAVRLRELNPLQPAYAVHEIIENRAAGQNAAADAALERFLDYHGATPAHVYRLGHLASEHGLTADIVRLVDHARDHGFPIGQLRLALIKSRQINHDWDVMRREAEDLLAAPDFEKRAEAVWIRLMALLAAVCAGESASVQYQLTNLALEKVASLDTHRTLLDSLVAAGRFEEAAQIAGITEGLYPDSDYLTSMRARIDAGLLEVRAQAEARRPDRQEPPPAPAIEDLRAETARLREAGSYSEALALLRRVRREHPEVLPDDDRWAAREEIALARAVNDLALLQMSLRTHLRYHTITPEETLALAKSWLPDDGEASPAALLVLRELVRAHPGFTPGLQTLEAWTPRPDPADETPEETAPQETETAEALPLAEERAAR